MLGWSPDLFWRATPAELGAVLGALAGPGEGAAPPGADEIAKLKGMFPDG